MGEDRDRAGGNKKVEMEKREEGEVDRVWS